MSVFVLPLFVACAAMAAWLANGVAVRDAALYLAYVGLAIAVPGMLLRRVMTRAARPMLEEIAIGVPLGVAAQILGYIVFASLGLGRLAWFAAPIFGVVSAWRLWRRPGDRPTAAAPQAFGALECVLIGVLCAASIGLMALRDFPGHPLPQQVAGDGLRYYRDMPWHLGNLSAAARSWPLENPRIAGEPLHYHVGFYILGAGTSTVTGIDVASLLFRLEPVLWVVLLAFQLVWIGRVTGGSNAVGIATAFLVLLCSDAGSAWRLANPQFFNLFVTDLFLSPTLLLGLILFLPALVVVGRLVSSEHPSRGEIAIGTVLLVAAGLTKSTLLPVFSAGAAGFALWQWIGRRRVNRLAVGAAVIGAVIFACDWPIVMPPSAAEAATMTWRPLGTLRLTPIWKLLRTEWSPSALTVLVAAGHAPAMFAGVLALVAMRRPLTTMQQWLVVIATAAAGPALLFTATGNGQLYFWFAGYPALAAVAAVGLVAWMRQTRTTVMRIGAAIAALAVALSVATVVFQSRPGVMRLMGDHFRMFQANPDHQVPAKPMDLSVGVVQGLVWVAQHTDRRAVVAVNDRSVNFYYSALSERAVFLEKYADVVDMFTRTSLAEREHALGELFGGGAVAMCAAARRYRIDYLIDLTSSPTRHQPDPGFAVVFSNADLSVVSLATCRAASAP